MWRAYKGIKRKMFPLAVELCCVKIFYIVIKVYVSQTYIFANIFNTIYTCSFFFQHFAFGDAISVCPYNVSLTICAVKNHTFSLLLLLSPRVHARHLLLSIPNTRRHQHAYTRYFIHFERDYL